METSEFMIYQFVLRDVKRDDDALDLNKLSNDPQCGKVASRAGTNFAVRIRIHVAEISSAHRLPPFPDSPIENGPFSVISE